MKKPVPTPRGFRPLTLKDKTFQPGDVGRMSNGDTLPVSSRMHGEPIKRTDLGAGWFRPLPQAFPRFESFGNQVRHITAPGVSVCVVVCPIAENPKVRRPILNRMAEDRAKAIAGFLNKRDGIKAQG